MTPSLSDDEVVPAQPPLTPVCCGEKMAFVLRAGLEDIRRHGREMMRALRLQILREIHISSCPAPRLLASLDRERATAACIYRCRRCGQHHFRMDQI